MGVDRIVYIKEHYSVLDYARDVLGLPVRRDGDRCMSIMPGPHKTNNAFVVYGNSWYDFSGGLGGDVIDLCAVARHDGDKGAAIRELAGDYGYSVEWQEYTQNLGNKVAYYHKQLRESDLHYLLRRGIRKETVDRLLIGYDAESDRLIIPYWKNGYVAYYVGRDRSGNPDASKYKKARLDGLNENIAWGLHTFDKKHEDHEYCVITEGAFDALSFEQEGFKVLSPISGYFSKDAIKQVIALCKTQEYVFICFDSDQAGTKFQVKMAETMFRHRIRFVCGELPSGYKDVSEYYEAGGKLQELVDGAQPGIPMLASRITDREEYKKFMYSAARYVDEPDMIELVEATTQFPKKWVSAVLERALRPPVEDIIAREILEKHTLKYMEGLGFYEYTHGVWERRSDNEIQGYFSDLLGRWATGSRVRTLLVLLKSRTTTTELFNRQEIFNFRNCVLDLESGEKREHSASYMSSVQAKYDYDDKAECPRWEQFIREVMASREPSMKLLQEMAGYILYTDSSLQKCFFLQGSGANGKSVLLNVLRAVFGEAFVSNVEMSGLVEPFQRINLINSLVNISTETSTNVKGAESVFKQIVVGDTINGCYKNQDFVNFAPRCVMISACNEYIKSKDTSDGFLRRICFVDFPVKFEGEKADPDLEEKLKLEVAGIFNWAYAGYKRLKEQKHFTATPEQAVMMQEFMQQINPVAAFIDETLKEREGVVTRVTLYTEYLDWCKGAGHETLSRTKFMQRFRTTLKQLLPEVTECTTLGVRCFKFPDRLKNLEDFIDVDGEDNGLPE